VNNSVYRHQIGIRDFCCQRAQIGSAAASIDRWTMPGKIPAAGWALIDEKATMPGADCDECKIPDCPPDRLLMKTMRAYSRTAIIELVGAHDVAME
jgi:hypothetical protein